MSYNIPEHVENPAAYENAIRERIKANAWKTKRANFERDEPELYAALKDLWFPDWNDEVEEWQKDGSHNVLHTMTNKERNSLLRKLSWLRDGFEQYGSLTEKQTAKAKEILAETKERVSRFEQEDELRKLNATPWPQDSGRAEHEVTVVSYKVKEVPSFNPYDRHMDLKLTMIVQREDGSRAWGTCPGKLADAVAERVDLNPYAEEFARHMRGVKLTLRATFTRADDDPIFAFFKRPHVVSIDEATLPVFDNHPVNPEEADNA